MNMRGLAVILSSLLVLLLVFSDGIAQAKEGLVIIPLGSGTNQSSPGYAPSTITVVIGMNNTVIWLNNDTAPHTVTPSTEPASGNWSVGSGNLDPGKSYQFTFIVPGRYTYGCAYHSWMHGTVVVRAGSTVPEFPVGSLSLILFVAVIAAVLAIPRLRQKVPANRGIL